MTTGMILASVNLRAVGRARDQVRIVVSAAIREGGITLTRRAIYRVNRVSASPGLRVRQAAPAGEAIKSVALSAWSGHAERLYS